MNNLKEAEPELRKPGSVRRKPVSLSQSSLVTTGLLTPGTALPLVIEPAVRGVNLIAWAASQRDFIEASLFEHGGVLFRNFGVKTASQLEQFVKAVSSDLLEYRERSSPRSKVAGNVYTSTEHPASQAIFLHNENSYQNTWPLKIFFFCETAPEEGGETPIADVRKVFARISPETRERFMRKGWMYVRNFGDGFGLPWTTVFQTTDKAAVEQYCHENGIEVVWKDGDRLRTMAVRPAIAKHPRTGEMSWFNHATFFHVSTLEPSIRDLLIEEFAADELPTNTAYGDGSQIELDVLAEMRQAYQEETVTFSWQRGDILLLDNMLVAHGRAPYSGARKILVGMSEPCSDRGV